MNNALENKRIVITGAFGTLGRAVADAVIAQGATVILLDKAPAPERPDGPLLCAIEKGQVDLLDFHSVSSALASVVDSSGAIDGIANVAGGFQWQTIVSQEDDAWDRMYAMNLKTTLNACRAAIPYLKRSGSGRIVNIAASAALSAAQGMGAYAASKAGVIKLTEALSDELHQDGINANALLPSIIDSPQNRRDMPDADTSRWVQPEAIAQAVVFLLSESSGAISGASIPVTRGQRN